MRTRIALAVGAAAVVAAIVAVVATRSSSKAVTSPPVLNLPPSSDFVANVDHPFFPLAPGTTFTYIGQQEGQPRKVTVFVTHKTKMIVGIAATVVLDQVFVDGQPEDKTWDWYAQENRAMSGISARTHSTSSTASGSGATAPGRPASTGPKRG
jgi:hypothetical protein